MRTPTYDDVTTGTWPWDYDAYIEIYIKDLDVTLEGWAPGRQRYEGDDDAINWDKFLETARLQGVEEDDEFFDQHIEKLKEIVEDYDNRRERTLWRVTDREALL